MTSDTQRSREFYGELFGWDAEEPSPEFGGYFNFSEGRCTGSPDACRATGAGQPDIWSVYLATDDAPRRWRRR